MASSGSIPANALCAADLQSTPIWRFRTDAEGSEDADESHVTPSTEPLALGTFGSYLVAATYGLKNGESLPGSVQVDIMGQKVHFTPAVVYAQGRLVDPLDPDAEQRLARIAKLPQTRLLHWELVVRFRGEQQARRGRIARSTFGAAVALFARLVLLKFSRRRQ